MITTDPWPTGERFSTAYRVKAWETTAGTVTTADGGRSDAVFVASPRPEGPPKFNHAFKVSPWDASAPVVAATATGPTSGALCVASPLLGCAPRGGGYGVMGWDETASTVAAACDVHAGRAAVADPRPPFELSAAPPSPPVILSPWGLWHRPLTDLELMVLQGFDPWETAAAMAGMSSSTRRQILGNAVPPPAAEAIADEFGATLLAAREGVGFQLRAEGIWVEPIT